MVALEPRFDDGEGLDEYRDGRCRAFLCIKRTSPARPATLEPPAARTKRTKESGAAEKRESRMYQTDRFLSEQFAFQRWKLSNAPSVAGCGSCGRATNSQRGTGI